MNDGYAWRRCRLLCAAGSAVSAVMIVCLAGHLDHALASRFAPLRGSSNYGIDFWREADGLPQSRIRAIAQTRDGYLWLGTDNGLFRFNGASFISFTVETGSLRDNEVSGLQEDDEGGLWIGTYGGGLTVLRNGRFTTFTTADGLPDDVVTRLDKDRTGGIWIATRSGVCCYAQGKLTRFAINNVPPDSAVTAISAASQQGILVASGDRLYRLVKENFEVVRGVVEMGDGVVDYLMSGQDGALWIGLHNGVIKKWKASSIVRYTKKQNVAPHVHRIYEDPQGTIWVAMQRGLYQLRHGRFEPVPSVYDQARLGVVYSLCTDREGSLWMGLESNGLARLRTKQLTTISSDDGLPNDSTRSVFQDSAGNTWIGTASGFASIKQGRIIAYNNFEGRRIGAVRSFAEDTDGNMWIGAGQDLLLLKAGRLKRCPDWTGTAEIKALYRDRGGRIWVGTDGDGVFVFDGGKIKPLTTSDGLAANHIRFILQDHSDAIWIATFGGGVSKYAEGRFTTYTTDDGLAGNRVLAIDEDDEGSLWFATRKGLSRLKEGRFFNFTAEHGLPASIVYAILDDGRGNFWFTGAQGLFKIRKTDLSDLAEGKIKRLTSVDFAVSDGMLTRAFNAGNQPTAWMCEDGSLMFCSMKGIVVADPASASSNMFIPPVYIESVAVNKQLQSLDHTADAASGSGELELNYSALSYLAPERVRFKYLLEGFDREWVDAGARRFAHYTNLPPGQYRFRVIAGNIDGVWNETGASFALYLRPRFFQTRWFLAVVVATLMILAWAGYRLRMLELKTRYSAVLAERNRIAREIHDTLAQNLAGVALQLDSVTMRLTDVSPELRAQLDQACDLTRYSLTEARRAVADLRSDELERRELAAALPEIADKITASAAVQTRVQVIGTTRRLHPVTEKNLLRIFQEAVANAVKHASPRTIDVELTYATDCLALRVRDDGSGFDTEKTVPLGVGHYGLTGMRERAERIGGRMILKSRPGEGTELLVEVPFSA